MIDEWMRKNVGPLAARAAALNQLIAKEPPTKTPRGFRRKKGERHESDRGFIR